MPYANNKAADLPVHPHSLISVCFICCLADVTPLLAESNISKIDKRKVQGVPQSQTAALPRHQEEEETDKTKQAQIEQTRTIKTQLVSLAEQADLSLTWSQTPKTADFFISLVKLSYLINRMI